MSEVSPPGQLNEGPLNSTLTLAPLPVDTNAKANDGRGLISYKDEAVLKIGGNKINLVSGYQMLISILNIVNASVLLVFIVEMLYSIHDGGGYLDSVIICLIVLAAGYGLILGPWIYSDIKDKKNWPVRFHRQRREVAIAARTCDNSKKQQQYFYIPWEQLNASLLQSKNVATTGVTETFSLNLWFNDKASGKQIQAKFDLGSAALVLGLWESIRAFMEKGPEYCPMDWYSLQHSNKVKGFGYTLQGYKKMSKGYKGFYERKRITAWEYYYGFHFKQWCQGGTIPYRLSDWHHKRGDMIRKKLLPKDTAWGKPLPQSQWAQPSAALQDMNTFLYKVYELGGVSFMEAMVKWQEHCSAKHERKEMVSDQV